MLCSGYCSNYTHSIIMMDIFLLAIALIFQVSVWWCYIIFLAATIFTIWAVLRTDKNIKKTYNQKDAAWVASVLNPNNLADQAKFSFFAGIIAVILFAMRAGSFNIWQSVLVFGVPFFFRLGREGYAYFLRRHIGYRP